MELTDPRIDPALVPSRVEGASHQRSEWRRVRRPASHPNAERLRHYALVADRRGTRRHRPRRGHLRHAAVARFDQSDVRHGRSGRLEGSAAMIKGPGDVPTCVVRAVGDFDRCRDANRSSTTRSTSASARCAEILAVRPATGRQTPRLQTTTSTSSSWSAVRSAAKVSRISTGSACSIASDAATAPMPASTETEQGSSATFAESGSRLSGLRWRRARQRVDLLDLRRNRERSR
jgi:hypothetical protein